MSHCMIQTGTSTYIYIYIYIYINEVTTSCLDKLKCLNSMKTTTWSNKTRFCGVCIRACSCPGIIGFFRGHLSRGPLKRTMSHNHEHIKTRDKTCLSLNNPMNHWVALLALRYLSNTASFVFYGNTCLIQLIEFAAVFVTLEEDMH